MAKKEEVKLNGIYEILNSLQLNLKSPKDKKNTFGKYSYRDAEGILKAAKQELLKDIYPKSCCLLINAEPKDIGNRFFMKATACLLFNNEKIETNAFAGLDESKKGMDSAQLSGAAISYAKKYALCNLLAIDDSEDDPDSGEQKAVTYITSEQGIEIQKLADEASIELKIICDAYKINSIVDLPSSKFNSVVKRLKEKSGQHNN